MIQVIEQTREEKVAMYMKLTKRELISMLMTNQEIVEARARLQQQIPNQVHLMPQATPNHPQWGNSWGLNV